LGFKPIITTKRRCVGKVIKLGFKPIITTKRRCVRKVIRLELVGRGQALTRDPGEVRAADRQMPVGLTKHRQVRHDSAAQTAAAALAAGADLVTGAGLAGATTPAGALEELTSGPVGGLLSTLLPPGLRLMWRICKAHGITGSMLLKEASLCVCYCSSTRYFIK